MLPGDLVLVFANLACHEGTKPCPGADHVLRGQLRVRKEPIGGVQQVTDVGSGGADLLGGALVVLIGRPDQREIAPRQHEHDPAVQRRLEDERPLVPDAVSPYVDVGAAGGPQQGLPGDPGLEGGLIRPWARRVDHDARADLPFRSPAGLGISNAHSTRSSLLHQDLGRQTVRRRRAHLDGGAHRGEHQARIVDLGVEVARAAEQALGRERRLPPEHLLLAQHLMPFDVPEQGERVVQPHPGRHRQPSDPAVPVEGEEKLQRAHHVRSDPEKGLALAARFEDEVELELLQVPEPAVDEAG